jgi:hypothetical protein
MSDCPYTDEELEKWDDVDNPMGDPCFECTDSDCIHNENYLLEEDFGLCDEDDF